MPSQSTVLARELKQIRSSFSQIARSFGKIGPLLASPALGGAVFEPERPSRRRPRLSAQQRSALKLQGKYMGTMRGLKPAQRSAIKKVRVEKGIRAAIAQAQRMASSN